VAAARRLGAAARGVTAAAALLTALLVAAPHAAADCPGLAQLSRATRLQQSLTWVTPQVIAIVARSDDGQGGLSTEQMERIGDAATDAYAPMALAHDVESGLAAHCDAQAVAAANAFYRGPLGVKIVRGGMELLTQSMRFDQEMYYRKLFEEGVANGRLDAARSIKPATLVYALTPRVRFALYEPVVRVVAGQIARAHGLPPPDANQISQVVAEGSARMRAEFDLMTDLGQLFSTRELSEAELQQYRGFLGSRAGIWYREQLQRGLERALDAAGQRFARAVDAPPP